MNIMTEFTNILTGAILPAFYLLYQLPLLLASGLLARRSRRITGSNSSPSPDFCTSFS